jgi:AcrR family transcriptional regulator
MRSAGRPRSEASRASILNTAYSYLVGHPVSAISIVHIARKAGVSTATVYRWWSTKEELLLDAFLQKAEPEHSLGCEGLPLERLKEYILQVGRSFTGENGAVIARLLTAIQEDQDLRREFLRRVYSPRDKEIRTTVKEAIKRGDLPEELNIGIFLDSIFGPLLARLLFRHERIDESFVATVFEHVVAGAKLHRATK